MRVRTLFRRSSLLAYGLGIHGRRFQPERSASSMIRRGQLSFFADDAIDEHRWQELGQEIMSNLSLDPESEAAQKRVYWLYLPIFEWLRRKQIAMNASERNSLVVGLQCPQGGGKTTMCQVLELLFAAEGKKCTVMSIDDFYLNHNELKALSARYQENALLAGRGPPGTHDTMLMRKTIQALSASTGIVAVPRYDKTAHNGSGDRLPRDQWPRVEAPVDIIILEGWCLGFLPQGQAVSDPQLQTIDGFLRTDLAPIYSLFDAFITLAIDDPDVVYDWREQAEASSRAKGLGAMSKSQVRAFIDRYMPLYRQYLPTFYAAFSSSSNGAKNLLVQRENPADSMLRIFLDRQRAPILPSP